MSGPRPQARQDGPLQPVRERLTPVQTKCNGEEEEEEEMTRGHRSAAFTSVLLVLVGPKLRKLISEMEKCLPPH